MKYPLTLIFCAMLSACGGGSESESQSEPAGSGALEAATYSGSGIGIWRYDNTSGSPATVNINIAGVSAGKVATLVFSNGSETTAPLPSSGVLASPVKSAAAQADAGQPGMAVAAQHDEDKAHAGMLERNRAVAAQLIRERRVGGPVADVQAAADSLSFPPAVGTSRSWNDNFSGSPVAYNASVQAVCELPSGRHVVWWVDPGIVSSGTFSASAWSAAFSSLQASYCGSAGGLTRITDLLGDVWGGASAGSASVIQDTPVLQDVNVVLLNVPASSQWAGYFYGEDTKRKASYASSNEALAFFINARQVKNDLDFATSTLLHESTHLVNFYQRSVARSVAHDTWLEETSAMMTEDIVAPAVIGGYNKALTDRLPVYLASGGNVSYINWPALTNSSANYAMGAGFGAFLNRRYGLSIYQQLVSVCGNESFACVDELIKTNGGSGFSDEFARFGTTVFGRFPASGMPAGHGYPAKQAGAYDLQAKDLSSLPLGAPQSLTSGYRETTHAYQRDTIAAGKTTYVRTGVVVPANTSLTVSIQ
ncbi:MAG: hypothetical protein M3R45_02425 [Pseudomonadota bacterium]|nr:hypothetical protein [Pseudomonadota bacterium]